MEIHVGHQKTPADITVFTIKGEITAESYEQLEERFDQEHQRGMKNLLLDLKRVSYMSSSGLRAIHHMFTALEGRDESIRKGISAGTFKSAHLKLANPSKAVLTVLTTTGYDYFLEIYDDLEKAIASFS